MFKKIPAFLAILSLAYVLQAQAQTIQGSGVPLTGAAYPGVILSAASNNSQLIGPAGAHALMTLEVFNTTAAVLDVRFYDVATAPTCSSATGVVANYPVPSLANGGGFALNFGFNGKAFLNGIGLCITGVNANNDNTNATTGLNLNYTYR